MDSNHASWWPPCLLLQLWYDLLMVVVVKKECELCPHPDHLDQEEVVVFGMGSDSARRKRGRMTSTRRPPVKDTSTWQTPCRHHGSYGASLQKVCHNSFILGLQGYGCPLKWLREEMRMTVIQSPSLSGVPLIKQLCWWNVDCIPRKAWPPFESPCEVLWLLAASTPTISPPSLITSQLPIRVTLCVVLLI